jgi:exodeoxyribonuclease-3
LKLLAWNIRHGGGSRAAAIANAILSHSVDVALLSEFRRQSRQSLEPQLEDAGLKLVAPDALNSINHVAMFSKTTCALNTPSPDIGHRWVEAVPTNGITIVGLHIPGSTDRKAGFSKAGYWDKVLRLAANNITGDAIIVGDLNTGLHRIDEAGKTFTCERAFKALGDLGFVDAWRHCNPGANDRTWYSAKGNGFRLDHAFISPSLVPRLASCRYSHSERESGLSDHSPLLLEIRE